MLIAQLTDTHVAPLDDGDELFVDNNARMIEAVARLDAEDPAPAVVVGTGDLTNDGKPAEFDALATLLEPLAVPFLPIPGNHDDRELMRATFPDVPWVDADHASWVTAIEGIRLVGLDSVRPGHPGGGFDDERERWLRGVLATSFGDGPTILAVHHPPFTTGIGWMDRAGFEGLQRLEAVLAEHPVDKVICGHLHRPVTSTIAGIPVQVGPSTVQSVELGLADDAPIELLVDPVGYLLHRVDGRRIVTHTRYIATGEQPFVPGWAAAHR